jgi:hypothetical protein
MNRCWTSRLALIAMASCGTSVALAQNAASVPRFTLAPVSRFIPELFKSPPDSFSMLSADRYLHPYNLAKDGYAEEEYLITGTANVYDWGTDGKVIVKTPNAPYGSRIRVRHPIDPSKFSGAVVVEIPNAARRFDWDMMWGYLSDEIIVRGDAWVAITPPAATPGLKTFDPVRYKGVSFANPAPGTCPNGTAASDMEEGLRWDMYSQVGALLKSGASGGPLAGFKVENLYMTTQGGDVVTYLNVIHPQAKLANGKFIYDGYLSKQPNGIGKLSQCGAAPPKGDPRHMIRNAGVPVIAVIAQGEVLGSLGVRRQDSDEQNDRFRLYEIAGGSHLDRFSYWPFASMADATAAGNPQGTPEYPFAARCTPEIQLIQYPLMPYIYHAVLNHLDNWARKGTTPPHGDRIQIKDADTPKPSVAMDQFGHALGGIRTFWVDYPTVTFTQNSAGPGFCPELGHSVPLEWSRLEALHGDYKSYTSKVLPSLEKSVREGWITQADANKIKADMTAAVSGPRTVGAN